MKNLSIKKLEKQIKELEDYFIKVRKLKPGHSRLEKLKEINDKLKKQTYNIAIVANMSAGKSTFINALFGEEILPSSNFATTDCATYIHSNKKVGKANIEEKAIITFKDGKKEKHLHQHELDELKKYATKDEDTTEEKYRNVEKIELYHPFKHIPKEEQKDDLEIYFVDTPGPNNQGKASNKHKTQTQEALENAHVALFLFDYRQFDATKNSDASKQEKGLESYTNDLWSSIKARMKSNPSFKVLFIVNKIDVIFEDAFKEKKGGGALDFVLEKKQKITQELEKIAKEKGIRHTEVFFTAALPAMTIRMYPELSTDKEQNDEQDEHAWFLKNEFKSFKSYFERTYKKSQETLQNFLGINTIEDKINDHLNTQASTHLYDFNQNRIFSLVRDEMMDLQTLIQLCKQPETQAKEGLENAKKIFTSLESLKEQLQEELENIGETTLQAIKKMLEESTEKRRNDYIEWITATAILFLDLYAGGRSEESAMRTIYEDYSTDDIGEALGEIFAKGAIHAISQSVADRAPQALKNYLNFCFTTLIIDSDDIAFQLDSIHLGHKAAHSKIIEDFKHEINKQIGTALNLDLGEFNLPNIAKEDYGDLRFDMELEGIDFQIETGFFEWIASLFRGERITMPLDYEEISEQIENAIIGAEVDFEDMQLERHAGLLANCNSIALERIDEYLHDQQTKLEALDQELHSIKGNLNELKDQEKELKTLEITKLYLKQGATHARK